MAPDETLRIVRMAVQSALCPVCKMQSRPFSLAPLSALKFKFRPQCSAAWQFYATAERPHTDESATKKNIERFLIWTKFDLKFKSYRVRWFIISGNDDLFPSFAQVIYALCMCARIVLWSSCVRLCAFTLKRFHPLPIEVGARRIFISECNPGACFILPHTLQD